MMPSLCSLNSNFFKNRVLRGFIYFLMLTALVMTLLNPIIALLPVIFMAVISFVFGVSEYKTGYLAVALSVCKNE